MITLTTAAWIAFAIVAILSTLLLRLSVRVVAKGADNGWDNALAYGVVTLLLAFPVGWLIGAGWIGALFAPLVVWIVQTVALRLIYEVPPLRAWALGVVHALLTTITVTSLTITAGLVAAYILYGKIISDPMFLIRLILRLIGIELPF
ncbi:hypothetical protein L6R52_03925 [Myxococcota bacterium]|nr:hypothetical protein [Myxococcota bacterium]